MNNQQHRKMNQRFTQKRAELEQAYWHAVTAQHRANLPPSTRRKWRDHAERAAESLRQMGIFVEGK